MKRREFITLLGGAVVVWPLGARGQQQALPVIGWLNPASPDSVTAYLAALLDGLKEGGFVEGRHVTFEYRWAEGQNDRLPPLAADLVRRQVNVIVAGGTPAALAAKAATATIPIVFSLGGDPVKAGLVASVNRPGGNVTGVTNVTTTLAAKRLDILHNLVPSTASIGVLIDPTGPSSSQQRADLQEAATALGLQLIFLNTSNETEIEAAFAILLRQRIGALIVTDSAILNGYRQQLVTLARFNAIPAMYTFREFAATGGLISYASSITQAFRLAGIYVARVLKGEKPADLPVQQPTKFELVINLKTAKALGLIVPDKLLALADEVIE
jgi:putative tryptophan/tyrosine transport system substrate-binding protein